MFSDLCCLNPRDFLASMGKKKKRESDSSSPPAKRPHLGISGPLTDNSEQPKTTSATPLHSVNLDNVQDEVKQKNICKSCNVKFSSAQALDFHNKVKTKALSKVKVDQSIFQPKNQMLVCQFTDCCHTDTNIASMGQHLTNGKHGSRKYMLTSGLVKLKNGHFEPSDIYVIPRGPLSQNIKPFTCPTCGEQLSTKDNFNNHVKWSCLGIAPWCCPHCGLQCKGRKQLTGHMHSKHPLPKELNLTGVFRGKKGGSDRKGDQKGGADLRNVRSFTFLAPKATCLTAEDIFDKKQQENLTFLIEEAKGGLGMFSMNINTGSLLLTANSKRLELFNTQSPLQVFSSTSHSEAIVNKVLSLVNTASRQAADASSGLSLHTIKSVTICFAARSGQRGAGGQSKARSQFPSSLEWANARRLRGAVSLHISDEEAKRDPSRQKKCFQHSVLHSLFYSEVKEKLKTQQEGKCKAEGHWKSDTDLMCKVCLRMWERKSSNQVPRTRGSVIPVTACASTYDDYIERLDWSGVNFPAGISKKLNPPKKVKHNIF